MWWGADMPSDRAANALTAIAYIFFAVVAIFLLDKLVAANERTARAIESMEYCCARAR